MSTNPITPNDQSSAQVWQPTTNPSDSDYSDETKAVKKYDSIYGDNAPPPASSSSSSSGTAWALSMAYTTAPDLVPVPESQSSSSGSGSTVPLADQFSVDL